VYEEHVERRRHDHAPETLETFFRENTERVIELSSQVRVMPMSNQIAEEIRQVPAVQAGGAQSLQDSLKFGDILLNVLMDETLNMDERYDTIREITRHFGLAFNTGITAIEDSEADNEVLAAMFTKYMRRFELELEFATRIMAGLVCFERFTSSEADRNLVLLNNHLQKLKSDERREVLVSYRRYLQRSEQLKEMLASTEPLDPVKYFYQTFTA